MLNTNLRIILSLSLVVFLFACKQESKQKTFNSFPAEYPLQAQYIELEEAYVHASVLVFDTLYFLTNTPNNQYQIHMYTHNFDYLGSGGKVGKGPGEIINPFMTRIDPQAGVLWFADMGRQELLKFPVDTLLKNPQFLPRETVSIPEDLWIITLYDPLADNLFSFADYQTPDTLLSFFNNHGKRIDSLSVARNPLLDNLKSKYEQDFMPTFSYEFHPEKKLFALAYGYSDILTILNTKGEIIALVQGPDDITQLPDMRDQHQIRCYAHIQVDDRYVYVLYNGKPVFDAQQKLNIPERIFVFDWDGQPVASLILEHPIPQFTLDRINNRFVAMSIITGDVVIYDIPVELYSNDY